MKQSIFLFIAIIALSCGKSEENFLTKKCDPDEKVCNYKRSAAFDECVDKFARNTEELDLGYRDMFIDKKFIDKEYKYKLEPDTTKADITKHDVRFKIIGQGVDGNDNDFLDIYIINKDDDETEFCGGLKRECVIRYTTADHKAIMGTIAEYKCAEDKGGSSHSVDESNERMRLKTKRTYEFGNELITLEVGTRFIKSIPLLFGDFVKEKIEKKIAKKKSKGSKYKPVSGSPFKKIVSEFKKVKENDRKISDVSGNLMVCTVTVNSNIAIFASKDFNLQATWTPSCNSENMVNYSYEDKSINIIE